MRNVLKKIKIWNNFSRQFTFIDISMLLLFFFINLLVFLLKFLFFVEGFFLHTLVYIRVNYYFFVFIYQDPGAHHPITPQLISNLCYTINRKYVFRLWKFVLHLEFYRNIYFAYYPIFCHVYMLRLILIKYRH